MLFEGARAILADWSLSAARPRRATSRRCALGSRLTKAQILAAGELLETYRNHCDMSRWPRCSAASPVELEEIL